MATDEVRWVLLSLKTNVTYPAVTLLRKVCTTGYIFFPH
jgi:hypothetical protein